MAYLNFGLRPRSLVPIRAFLLIIISAVLVSSIEYREIQRDGTTKQNSWTNGDKCQDSCQEMGSLVARTSFCYKSNDPDNQVPTQTSNIIYNEDPALVNYITPIILSWPSYPIKHQGPGHKEPDCYVGLTQGSTMLADTESEDLNAIKSIDFLEFPPWYYREPPPHPGITVVPPEIPEYKISTFLGSLGHARSKGFVIPVNKEGVPGWEKRALEEDTVVVILPESTGSGSVTSTKVLGKLVPTSGTIGGQTIHTVMAHRIKPFYGQTHTASTISNKPTSAHNAAFKESIKLASIQAFSQMGIVLIALLIIAGIAVIFICISSFLKFPIPCLRKLRFKNIKKAAKKLKSRKMDTRDIDFEELVGNATLNPYARARYLRGTAEAIDNNSSFQGDGHMSGGSTGSGTSMETKSITATVSDFRHTSTIEDNDSAVATGSQSKLTGVKLRRTRSC